ncbi:Serine/threonine-protein kinase PknB [Caulifigura coniformis]|uniref:Serine/threonine-protein kinase PknB n=1 Tax=Caulifigura coniformis TaxID=2527983 RepID=A0A517S8X5_9PLAN|nr:serine/threonine protein kinase [Caulifigura coniformis]QDT52562.1 Serine/threonine-protein kinase PknB [Caulifigura coniformis]
MIDFKSFLSRSSRGRQSHAPAHLSFARSRVGRTISRTGLLLKKQLWVFPLLAVVGFLIVHLFVREAIESTMKQNLSSQLEALLKTEAAMLETWLKIQESNAVQHANDQDFREDVYKLLDFPSLTSGSSSPEALSTNAEAAALRESLRKDLQPALTAHRYEGFAILDRTRTVLASDQTALIGQTYSAIEVERLLERVLSGETVVTTPFPSQSVIRDERGVMRAGVPTMWVLAPIRDPSYQVVAILGLRIRPDREFTRILQLGQIGETGETYAFDRNGRMVSNSRFDDLLILLGIIPDTDDSRSILNVQLRDPGGDLTKGYRPTKRRSELPLTPMAADAIQGHSGVDVDGRADYRGVQVVTAWTWLPRYELGISTKIDAEEAFRPLTILRRTFWALMVLLILAAIAIFIFTLILARLRREAQKAAIDSKKLGQYTLETKLGSGGMGVVYKGRHAVLRRMTAIKLLNVDKVNDSSIERFEREVQITSQLNNPNTVAIYDYGRTEEGIFYYAMEYIEGIDLQVLVDKYGPQSEARTIHILRQICGSLFEAHSLGLVHRDIKPANVMLARRGGEPDVAKVLDFGLVKALDNRTSTQQTAANSLTGTPLYMSPEAIQTPDSVDPRSDLYAVGAVGYFLLTGKNLFDTENIVELCQAQVSRSPIPPSERIGRELSPELEGAIMSCLEKSPARRPQTARDLSQLLFRSPAALKWSVEEADHWWGRHERGLAADEGGPASGNHSGGAKTTPRAADYGQTVVGQTDLE